MSSIYTKLHYLMIAPVQINAFFNKSKFLFPINKWDQKPTIHNKHCACSNQNVTRQALAPQI